MTRLRCKLDRMPEGRSWRRLAAACGRGLAIVVALAAGNDSVPGAGRNDSVADAGHVSAGGDPDDPAPAGQLDLVVSHQMDRGRLIVRLAGSAFLSLPFASGDGAPARFERPLSVPSGRHPVEISFLDRRGRVVAQKRTEGTVAAGRSVILHVDEHRGTGDGLTLTWRTP